jgi:general stress protein YciG
MSVGLVPVTDVPAGTDQAGAAQPAGPVDGGGFAVVGAPVMARLRSIRPAIIPRSAPAPARPARFPAVLALAAGRQRSGGGRGVLLSAIPTLRIVGATGHHDLLCGGRGGRETGAWPILTAGRHGHPWAVGGGKGDWRNVMARDESNKDMTVREAGQMGGEATKREVRQGELPKDFYETIGKKGGETTAREVESGELPKDFYEQIGHKGGEAVKREVATGDLPKDFYSEIGHKGGQKVKELIDKGREGETTT